MSDIMALKKGIPLANIRRVDIVTEESTPRVMCFDSGSEATAEPFVSEGTESELRVKNQIYAQNNTETIVKGYNVSLTDVVFQPEVFAIVDGGKSTVSSAGEFEQYGGPVAGEETERIPFTTRIITEEKDYNGDVLSYMVFEVKHCKGTPASFSIKDGEFYSPAYTIKSRPKQGERPIYMYRCKELPRYVVTADDLPAEGKTGVDYFVLADITAGETQYTAGDILKWDGAAYAKKNV